MSHKGNDIFNESCHEAKMENRGNHAWGNNFKFGKGTSDGTHPRGHKYFLKQIRLKPVKKGN